MPIFSNRRLANWAITPIALKNFRLEFLIGTSKHDFDFLSSPKDDPKLLLFQRHSGKIQRLWWILLEIRVKFPQQCWESYMRFGLYCLQSPGQSMRHLAGCHTLLFLPTFLYCPLLIRHVFLDYSSVIHFGTCPHFRFHFWVTWFEMSTYWASTCCWNRCTCCGVQEKAFMLKDG